MRNEFERRVGFLYAGTPYDQANPPDAFSLISYQLGRRSFVYDPSVPDVSVQSNRGTFVIRVSPNHPADILHWWAARGLAGADLLRRRLPMSPAWADAYARTILLPGAAVGRHFAKGDTPETVALERVIPLHAAKLRFHECAPAEDSGIWRVNLSLLPLPAGNREAP